MSARSDVEATQTQAATGVTPDTIRSTLVNELDAMQVDIEDVSGMGTLYLVSRTPLHYCAGRYR